MFLHLGRSISCSVEEWAVVMGLRLSLGFRWWPNPGISGPFFFIGPSFKFAGELEDHKQFEFIVIIFF